MAPALCTTVPDVERLAKVALAPLNVIVPCALRQPHL
jgi:hypothetical protein